MGLPVYDLAHAHYTLGVGADFLGGWASPVYYARQFGEFRQGRRQIRGQLVQAESRLSVTAAAADRWLPLRPGTEPQFLAAVGRLLLDGRLARNAEALPKPVARVFQEADPARLLAACGLDEKRVRQVVQELGESEAPLVLAGASIPQTNSVDAIVDFSLRQPDVGQRGQTRRHARSRGRRAASRESRDRAGALAGAGGVHRWREPGLHVAALRWRGRTHWRAPSWWSSFGTFLDDSSAWADILMPDHHELESAMALLPAVSAQQAVAVSTPFVEPLYDTRAVETTLAELAAKIGAEYRPVTPKDVVQPLLAGGITYDDVARQGGLWLDTAAGRARASQCGCLGLRAGPLRRRCGPISVPIPALPVAAIPRWQRRAPPVAAGTARPGLELHLGLAGGDRSRDCGEVTGGERRHGARGVAARVARSARPMSIPARFRE